MIRLKDFSCYYKVKEGFAVAVDHVDLEISKGEFLVLMGPSGCGKTSLLRSVLALTDYTEGELTVDGVDVNAYNKRDNAIAYVSQEYVLYPHLTVYENIAYPLRSSRLKQEKIDPLVRKMAEAVGLERLLTRLPRQLSGGQQQRLAIARALVKEPQIVLYDEPFSNMDPDMRQQLRELVYRISREQGQTVVYVTHDPEEARTLADRVVWMEEGRLAGEQRVPEDAPQWERPARLAPRMNFFRQKAAARDYGLHMLPKTRKAVFWDAVKLQGWKLLLLGLLLLAFSLPIHLLALAEDLYLAQLYAQTPQPSMEVLTARAVDISNLRALLNIPFLLLTSLALAGAGHMLRQYAWGEPVVFWYDFRKGIRQNGWQMAALGLIAGLWNALCVYCGNLSYTQAEGLAAYLVYLPAAAGLLLLVPLGAIMTACIPVYSNRFAQNCRLAAVLLLHEPARLYGALLCLGIGFVSFLIPNFYCHLFGRLLLTVLVPFLMLGWYLICYALLDRKVNPRFFPQLVGRGTVVTDRHETGGLL